MVQEQLELGPGVLGFALLGMAAGALVAIPVAGALVPRWGSRCTVALSALGFFGALTFPAIAPDLPALVAALVLLGGANGAIDVAMNAQGVAVERVLGRPILSTCHGLWSLGGLVGSGGAALALQLGVPPAVHLATAAAVFGGVAASQVLRLLPASADVPAEGPRLARPRGTLAILGAMAFLALLAEGAMGDWSAVYLRQELAAAPQVAALGFAAFSLAMAAGRFAGDRLVAALGAVTVIRGSTWLGALGLCGALVAESALVAIAGCACVGLGVANLIPIFFRAAAAVPAVGTAGYCGLLAGPAAIGLAAEVVMVRGGLGLVVVALLAIAFGAGRAATDGVVRP
jgi:hypothetical protein